jgi:hypothetical protein
LVGKRYLETRYLETRYLETRYLETRYLETRYLETRYLGCSCKVAPVRHFASLLPFAVGLLPSWERVAEGRVRGRHSLPLTLHLVVPTSSLIHSLPRDQLLLTLHPMHFRHAGNISNRVHQRVQLLARPH